MVTATSTEFFDFSPTSPAVGSLEFSLQLWDSVRARALAPAFHGRLDDSPERRLEFLVGARLMGYELVDLDDEAELARLKSMSPPRYPLQPQQLLIADALNAPGYSEYVVEIARRAAKTTTIFILLLGRCASRPGYFVTFSAQSGVKSSARLREWQTRLDLVTPDPEAGRAPWQRGGRSKAAERQVALFGEELAPSATSDSRGFRVLGGTIGTGIYFENGSQFLVFKPEADAYRGEAADVSWVDEAQELDPEEGAELFAGIIPLQDTRPGASRIISGTTGEERRGPFWDRVDRLRGGGNIGGVDYCAPEDTPWELIEDENSAMELLQRVHPGIGTLTTLEVMRENYQMLPRPQWAREYLSLWPETYGEAAINAAEWTACGLQKKPARPDRVAFGLAIKPGGGTAAIVAAWRSKSGLAHVELVEHRSGTTWLPERLKQLAATYRNSVFAYDDISEGRATAVEAERLGLRLRLFVQPWADFAAGCISFMREITRGTLRHSNQIGLNAAVASAARREIRNERGIWVWTPSEPGVDITPLDAATRALLLWDRKFARRSETPRKPVIRT